jgi:hypothetical protein
MKKLKLKFEGMEMLSIEQMKKISGGYGPLMIKLFFLNLTILLNCFFISTAQKLPNIQQSSKLAPGDLKIDGKLSEWGRLEAYNKATGLFYTIANDYKNLYLAIQANDPDVLTKITHKGVVFVIHGSGKKDNQNAVTIQYPVFELRYNNKPYIQFSNSSGLTAEQRRANESNPDSMLMVMNKRLKANDKFIRTSGIANVDTMLSIYNEAHISADETFSKGPVYNYELAIPLSYLKLSGAKFFYHIILNGLNVRQDLGLALRDTPNGKAYSLAPGAVTIKNERMPAVMSITDFYGEYTLAE